MVEFISPVGPGLHSPVHPLIDIKAKISRGEGLSPRTHDTDSATGEKGRNSSD